MKRSAPKQWSWIIAVILGILGLLGALFAIPFLSDFAFWLVLVALVLMLLATFF